MSKSGITDKKWLELFNSGKAVGEIALIVNRHECVVSRHRARFDEDINIPYADKPVLSAIKSGLKPFHDDLLNMRQWGWKYGKMVNFLRVQYRHSVSSSAVRLYCINNFELVAS